MAEPRQTKKEQLEEAPSNFWNLHAKSLVPIPRSALEKIHPVQGQPNKGLLVLEKGRPKLYTRDNVKQIMESICLGLPLKSAAAAIGIQAKEVYRWIDKYEDLRDCITQGRAIFEQNLTKSILGGIAQSPKLAMDFLERRYPSDWAPTKEVKHSGFLGHVGVGAIDLGKLSDGRNAKESEIVDVKEAEPIKLTTGEPQDVVVHQVKTCDPLPLPSAIVTGQRLT